MSYGFRAKALGPQFLQSFTDLHIMDLKSRYWFIYLFIKKKKKKKERKKETIVSHQSAHHLASIWGHSG